MQKAGVLIYLGDLDLAGNDIEQNTRSVLERDGVKLEVPGGNYQARTSVRSGRGVALRDMSVRIRCPRSFLVVLNAELSLQFNHPAINPGNRQIYHILRRSDKIWIFQT
jgi:hypothetical protein